MPLWNGGKHYQLVCFLNSQSGGGGLGGTVKHLTPAFNLGPDIRIVRSSPTWSSILSLESAYISLSLFHPTTCAFSLSQINKYIFKKISPGFSEARQQLCVAEWQWGHVLFNHSSVACTGPRVSPTVSADRVPHSYFLLSPSDFACFVFLV